MCEGRTVYSLKPNQPKFFFFNLEIVRTRSTTRQEVFVYKGKFLEPQPRVPSTLKKKRLEPRPEVVLKCKNQTTLVLTRVD
jgi:hypothetical protein